MRISDWSSDVCSSDLQGGGGRLAQGQGTRAVGDRAAARALLDQRALGLDQVRRVGYHLGPRLQPDGRQLHRQVRRPRRHHLLRREVRADRRSEEHTSELKSLMSTQYAGFSLKKKKTIQD